MVIDRRRERNENSCKTGGRQFRNSQCPRPADHQIRPGIGFRHILDERQKLGFDAVLTIRLARRIECSLTGLVPHHRSPVGWQSRQRTRHTAIQCQRTLAAAQYQQPKRASPGTEAQRRRRQCRNLATHRVTDRLAFDAWRKTAREGLKHNPGKTRQKSVGQSGDRVLLMNNKRSSCHPCSEATRPADKSAHAKYGCRPAASYEEILKDPSIEAIINTTPNNVHQETTRQAAHAGKHTFLDKPIANTVRDGQAIAQLCEKAGVVVSLGYQRRRESQFRWIKSEIDAGRFGRLVQAEANISRDRLGQFDLSSWRYQASGMPGGVMLQIGIHYVDVLEMLMGPVKRVSGMSAQLVLPGDNPDVANLILEHDSGAISSLTASYASASEYYMMNIYGKEATAYYDLFGGLRHLKRGETSARPVAVEKNDTIREELDEFAHCARNGTQPETDGFWAARNLAVIKAGAKSAKEGRVVEVAEILASGE